MKHTFRNAKGQFTAITVPATYENKTQENRLNLLLKSTLNSADIVVVTDNEKELRDKMWFFTKLVGRKPLVDIVLATGDMIGFKSVRKGIIKTFHGNTISLSSVIGFKLS